MNTARITPPDLNKAPYKDLIEHLAVRWVVAELNPEWFWEGQRLPEPINYLYLDYLVQIGTLLLTTQNPDQTQLIFMSVLNQAEALGKSSFWVEEELKFEGMVDGADRTDFLNFELSQADHVDDILLDQYSERLARFNPPQIPTAHEQ